MGVYIKGMKMPTGERPIHIEIHRDGTVLQWKFNESDEIIGTAIEVPPGRLIDADALMNLIREHSYPLTAHFNSTDNGMFTIGIQQAVDETPTIIEKKE